MNNMLDIKKILSNGNSPKEFVMNFIKQNSNPMLNNILQMAEKGETQGLEQFARNLFKEQGRNFDEEFNNFMSNFK